MDRGTRGKVHNRTLIRAVTWFHRVLYQATGGFIGGMIAGAPQLLLTTVGRKSGRKFTVPLLCLPYGADLVVVASYGGCAEAPQWWKNLQVNPTGWVQLGVHRWQVQAERAGDALKAELWPVFCHYYPGYEVYQSRTDRVIPLVLLRPSWAGPRDRHCAAPAGAADSAGGGETR